MYAACCFMYYCLMLSLGIVILWAMVEFASILHCCLFWSSYILLNASCIVVSCYHWALSCYGPCLSVRLYYIAVYSGHHIFCLMLRVFIVSCVGMWHMPLHILLGRRLYLGSHLCCHYCIWPCRLLPPLCVAYAMVQGNAALIRFWFLWFIVALFCVGVLWFVAALDTLWYIVAFLGFSDRLLPSHIMHVMVYTVVVYSAAIDC